MTRTELLATCQSIQGADEKHLLEIAERMSHEPVSDDERSEIGCDWLGRWHELTTTIQWEEMAC